MMIVSSSSTSGAAAATGAPRTSFVPFFYEERLPYFEVTSDSGCCLHCLERERKSSRRLDSPTDTLYAVFSSVP